MPRRPIKPAKKSTPRRRAASRAKLPRARKRTTPEKRFVEAQPHAGPPVRLVTRDDTFEIASDLLENVSIYWSYVVRTRARWASDESTYESLVDEVRERLAELDITDAHLETLARAGLVEVQIPATDDSTGWAARTLPWESLLAAATYRHTRRLETGPPLVVRHFALEKPPAWRQPKNVLFVQTAPGRLAEVYSFDEERKLVEISLGLKALKPAKDPTRAELQARIRGDDPDIVHVTGIDLHQGGALLGKPDEETKLDGVYLAGEGGAPDAVRAHEFASLFASPNSPPPLLVACNLYHSAARIAAGLVSHGVGAAIGVQDELDDMLIERFFGAFYRAWRASNWDLVAAFRAALTRASAYAPMRGSGMVLWSGRSLVRAQPTPAAIKARATKAQGPRPPAGPRPDGRDARDWFAIDVKPPKEINYSLLHNREKIFEKFTIAKLWPGAAEISVEVQLFVGQESFPYRTSVALAPDSEFVDLAELIHAPLLSRFLRSNRENVNTCLYVEVRYGNAELRRDTFPVKLLAVDEWKFDPSDDSRWLASFVLPRDPAVLRIVNAAQRYVTSLRDDPGAGFDGYQSTDPEADDPDAAVDLQVRGIWSALISDIQLAYINPPPTFTENAQRLRTPSDTVDGQRGTCIDLALLFAACLEYVDIYPVIFVLKDHAFPGYWRNEESHDRYLKMKAAIPAGRTAQARGDQSFDEFDEVTQLVNSGDLVPLETVWLTQRRGFQEAIDAGLENLINRSDFGALLDVKQARSKGVTPLPIAGGVS
jgi:hypothetical protein